jgi:uncharacterized protein (DUF2236 family)
MRPSASTPQVGHGVVESKVDSGNFLRHPWKRARTTFLYLAVAILGTQEDRVAFREAVNSAHRHVKSTADSPVRYNAFDRELQCGSQHAFSSDLRTPINCCVVR